MRRVGTVCLAHPQRLQPVGDHLAARYEVVDLIERGGQGEAWITWPAPVDLLWIEGAGEGAAQIIDHPKPCPIVVRLREGDPIAGRLAEIDWSKVDLLLVSGEAVRDFVLAQFELARPQVAVVPPGVDLQRFWSPGRRSGRSGKIGWAGSLSSSLEVVLLIQACAAVHRLDRETTFHLATGASDGAARARFDGLARLHGLQEVLVVEDRLGPDRMPRWYVDKDYLLSTAPWPSADPSIAEALACGCVPLAYQGPASSALDSLAAARWRTPDDLTRLLDEPEALADAASVRRERLEDVGLPAVLGQIDALVDGLVERGARFPSLACCIVASGDDPWLASALHSTCGAFDEVACIVDPRQGERGAQVARAAGARVLDGPPVLFHGGIDLAAARNRLADRVRADWVFVLEPHETIVNAGLIRCYVAQAQRRGCDAVSFEVARYSGRGRVACRREVRAYRNGGAAGFRFPVCSELHGVDTVFEGAEVRIRANAAGRGDGRASAADTLGRRLRALWGEREEDAEPRVHAASWLCRWHAERGEMADAARWAKACEDACPADGAPPAALWPVYARAVEAVRGNEDARAVIARGLVDHPDHADLLYERMRLSLDAWRAAAEDRHALHGAMTASRRFLLGIERASAALGLPPRGARARAIDWDAWRADYAAMSFDQLVAFYERVERQHPHQRQFDAGAVQAFFDGVRGPARVVEIGGWDGALAAGVLASHGDRIASWTNYEVCRAAARRSVVDDPRYAARVPPDYLWRCPQLLADADVLVASHVVEHMLARDVTELVACLGGVRQVYLEAPIADSATAQDWTGYAGSHILEIGWAQLDEIMAAGGFELIGRRGDAASYRRAVDGEGSPVGRGTRGSDDD